MPKQASSYILLCSHTKHAPLHTLRLGDAFQRWLRQPPSWSLKSTIKENHLKNKEKSQATSLYFYNLYSLPENITVFFIKLLIIISVYRITDFRHEFIIKIEIVQDAEAHSEHLSRAEQMTDICL